VDDREVTEEALGPRTSTEKIAEALASAGEVVPTDEKTGRLQQMFKMLVPMVSRLGVIPEDPAELDELLLNGARLALALRSDDAETPETIAELLQPKPPAIDGEAEEVLE